MSGFSRLYTFLRAGFGRPEAGLCLLTAAYAVGGLAVAAAAGRTGGFSPLLYSDAVGLATLFLGLAAVAGRVVYVMVKKRPARLGAFLLRDARTFGTEGNRLARAVPVFLCFTVFISVFTSLKTMIPAVQAFSWDERFMRLDHALHGTDPWRLLQPLLGYPPVTAAVNMVYNAWFFVMFAILYWQLFSIRRPLLRLRFFYTFLLTWTVNGTVLAMMFSSAGPCFYQAVTGSDHYVPLTAYLHATAKDWPVPAVATQDMLWRSYKQTGIGLGVGISAMPSVHVASAFLFMLLGWKNGRVLGAALTLFFLTILLGSVHLGWHYAVDGYAAIIVTALLWAAVGRFLPREIARVDDGVGELRPGEVGVVEDGAG